MLKRLFANGLWTLSNGAAEVRFRRALARPRASQQEILFRFLRRNRDTVLGRLHGFGKIGSVGDFQAAVPVRTYEDFEPWIERMMRGEPNVLTREPVLFFEKTSGSAGAAKHIPCTRSFLEELQAAASAWMFDLFTQRTALLPGTQYWSLSPAARRPESTTGGIPIGIDDDTAYLGPLGHRLLRSVLAVPAEVARIQDMDEWRRATLDRLVACRSLRFISVWNPSFLLMLLSALPGDVEPRDVWPELRLISCWAAGEAARLVPELGARFPGVEIQGKGLLATEGAVSIPRVGEEAPRLALTSHFLEFLDPRGEPHLAGELESGRRYSVVMTTGGGLVRYALGDEVEAVGPCAVDLVGRGEGTSDLRGEKLSERFVASVLAAARLRFGLGGFALLAPEVGCPPRYALFYEGSLHASEAIASFVEDQLRASFHYDYCRRLGQLEAVAGVRVRGAEERYLSGCAALGQRLGSVKPASLRREPGWRGRLVSREDEPHGALVP